MLVEIVGYSAKDAEELIKAAKFFGSILFDKALNNEITVIIQHDPELDLQGECWPENIDQEYDNRIFRISLNDSHTDSDETISTLAHELVHVKQWAKNEYILPVPAPKTLAAETDEEFIVQLWMGEEWFPAPKEDPVFDAPWEVEAYGREVGLIARWKKFKRMLGISRAEN